MNSVWIVFLGFAHERSVAGCFSSKEKAEAYVDTLAEELKPEALIDEYPVDREPAGG